MRVCIFMGDDKNIINLHQLNDETNQDIVMATQFRQTSQRDVNTILNLIEEQHDDIFVDLQRVGIPRNITKGFIRNIVNYVLRNEGNYSGNLQQRSNQINRDMRRSNTLWSSLLG